MSSHQVGDEDLLQSVARLKIAPILARIQYARRSLQMALLADTVPRIGLELPGINDGAWHRVCYVARGRSMTALAGDRGEWVLLILVFVLPIRFTWPVWQNKQPGAIC